MFVISISHNAQEGRQIRTFLRETMTEARLSGLATLSIDIAQAVDIDDVLNLFASFPTSCAG